MENNMRHFTIFPKKTEYSQKLDLLNDAIYQEQLMNVQQYQRKSLVGKIGFVSFGAAGCSLLFFRNNDTLGILGIIGMVFGFVGSLFARCPHCNSLQPGRVYGLSFSGGSLFVSYSKGIWPFASRCVKCEYYLSSRKLNKDLLLQSVTQTEQSEAHCAPHDD